ncbi:MAG: NUDIX hydrolase [Clostridia bacterium]|nr:NUDIX hydrolase [Clostridia bacterium]
MKSTDNKYLVIKNIYDKTNIIGGVADIQDFDEESFIPEKCLEREIKEELGISLKNPKDIKKYDSKYLRIPGKNENYYTCGILYTAELNYTSEQFKKYFYKTKEKLDNEIKEIYFYTKDEVLNLNLDDIDIKYLRDFIKAENPD